MRWGWGWERRKRMSEQAPRPFALHPLRWFPEFWELGRRRLRPQARLLALSLLVGVIAGVGALAFHAACQVVVRYSLEAVAGYYPQGPTNEPPLFHETPAEFRGNFSPCL